MVTLIQSRNNLLFIYKKKLTGSQVNLRAGRLLLVRCEKPPFWEVEKGLEDFQTEPFMHHRFLKMTPREFYISWKWSSLP